MSDHLRDPAYPVARKTHRCIACGAFIPTGEKYVEQTGHWDGCAFRNKFHQECWDVLAADGEFEFEPGELEPPERLKVVP